MEIAPLVDLLIAIITAVLAFIVPFSTRQHRTRVAAFVSILATISLIFFDRYLYIATGRNLIDTVTCWSFPNGRACQVSAPSASPTGGSDATLEPTPSQAQPSEGNALAQAERNSSDTPPPMARDIPLTEANARSVWVTSVYAYGANSGGGGGGMADDRLRIGGWGDKYVSLLSFDLPDNRTARRAVIIFTVKADDERSTPTAISYAAITQPWSPGTDGRVLWKDLPPAEFQSDEPAPANPGSKYELDITSLYNDWVTGRRRPYGLMLEPANTNNNFSTFYSTRARDGLRPQLRLTY